MKEEKEKKKKKKKKFRALRIFAKFMLGLLVFLLLLVLFIRSEWGQNIIVQKAVNYVSDKTNTKVAVDKLYVTFDGDVLLEGLFLEDKKGDTLVYSKSLEADIPFWPIIRGEGVGVESVDCKGLRANIIRRDSINGYNFQFLADAFASETPQAETQDTVSEPMNLILGSILIEDANVVFIDDVVGIDSRYKVGTLRIDMEKADLENFDFRASEGYVANSRIRMKQTPVPINPNVPPAPLPYLAIDELTIKNTIANYESIGDGIAAELGIVDLYAEIPKANLAANDIEITEFYLINSIINVNATVDRAGQTSVQESEVSEIQPWPELLVSLSDTNIENTNISYSVNGAKPAKNTFNPEALFLKNLNLTASTITLRDKRAEASIENVYFTEESGLDLKQLEVQVVATDKQIAISDLVVQLNRNSIEGNATLSYSSLSNFIQKPENTIISAIIPAYQLDVNEAFRLQPSLRNNEYLRALSKKLVSGNLRANGSLSRVQIPSMSVRWGRTTKISGNGSVSNMTEPDNVQFNFPRFTAETLKKDLLNFVNEDELGVDLPQQIQIAGSVGGSPSAVSADAKITTSQGLATIEGSFKSEPDIAFDGVITINEYQLDKLLKNESLGTVSLTATAKGSGGTINTLDATLNATVTRFELPQYTIEDLSIDGEFKNGSGLVTSDYKDENINLDLDATVQLDSVATQASVSLNLKGANLQGLGLMKRDVRTGLKLDADFTGNADSYDVISTIGDGVVVYDNKTYLLGGVTATAHVRKDTTSIWLDNKLMHLELESNTDPATLGKALQRHVSSYFNRKTQIPDSVVNPAKLTVRGKISQAPVLNDVFLVNVKDLDTITLAADFDEKARKLKANITAPHINYAGNEIDSLAFNINTNKDAFTFDLGFNEINAGPVAIQRTKITGNQSGEELALSFLAYQEEEKLIQIQSTVSGDAERVRFHIVPDSLLIQKNLWQTPSDNEVILTENKINFNNFSFRKGNQSVVFRDDLPNEKDHVGIDFGNFELGEILNYLNPEEEFANGTVNGQFVLEDVFGTTGIIADVTIDNLNALDVPLGTLSLDAQSQGGTNYDFQADLEGGEIDLALTGGYVAGEDAASLDMDLDITRFNMKALEGFTLDEIKNADGSFQGNFKVSGTTADPVYAGKIVFNDADFTVTKLNAPFTLASETINVTNEGLSMSKFTVRDEDGNTFTATGSIGTESFINPTFDLQLKAKNFKVLNASEADNDFLYGTAAFGADATLKGDLQIPKLDVTATVSPTTDVTYVLPSAAVNIEERDGVVVFVNRENPDAILTSTQEQTATVTGFDINAKINVTKEARVNIIIDQETGDNFEVFGDGDLVYTMKPNGRMTLSGVYDIQGGHYEMNLYNLVNRRFELDPSSRVTWSGDPFDAKLDVRAIYDVKASASPLMASVTSGSDPAIKTKFRQVLPFYVYLNVEGELTQPKINFNLDMPEDEQGAIGGQVYGRVQQLNSQEAELNKQVFSLLVLNRFYPEPGSDGSRGGAASIARDNINDALSDQLNVFSDKLLGDTGVELDFGLDSYTDYQGDSPQERTQLDIAAQKKLFNDRLIVRVGSEVDIQGSSSNGEATPLVGNVSLEYILTENGRYRLKGFRRNEFENVIDGQTVVSGLALIFTQEFNKFSELWEAILNKQTEAEKEAAEAARKAEDNAEEELENKEDPTNENN